jgi:hypothetical protein
VNQRTDARRNPREITQYDFARDDWFSFQAYIINNNLTGVVSSAYDVTTALTAFIIFIHEDEGLLLFVPILQFFSNTS